MSNMLALSFGSQTGFCVFNIDPKTNKVIIINSGAKFFENNLKLPLGARFSEFRKWLKDILVAEDINFVCYQQIFHHSNVNSAHAYGGFLYHMAALCDELWIPLKGLKIRYSKRIENDEIAIKLARLLSKKCFC